MEQEGRLAQAQAAEAELLDRGLTRRQVQEKLVDQFQPANGTLTRCWKTPDSWKNGRKCFRRPSLSPKERHEEDLLWVNNHLGRVKPEDAPDPQKRAVLVFAEQRPAEFIRAYEKALPGITRRQKEREAERKQRREEAERRREQEEWDRLEPQREEEARKKRARERKQRWRLKKKQGQVERENLRLEAEARERRRLLEAEAERQRKRQRKEKEKEEKALEKKRLLEETRERIEALDKAIKKRLEEAQKRIDEIAERQYLQRTGSIKDDKGHYR
jgi:hypothetical protein